MSRYVTWWLTFKEGCSRYVLRGSGPLEILVTALYKDFEFIASDGFYESSDGYVSGHPYKRPDHQSQTVEFPSVLWIGGIRYLIEEFDPGSERTLAAWLKHASRTRKFPSGDD